MTGRGDEAGRVALIAGISGQDGAYLAQFLLARGYRVCGTSRDGGGHALRNLERLGIRDQLAISSMMPSDFRSVLHAVSATKPDEIYNLSGQSSVALSFEQPVETLESISTATLNFLEVIRYLGRDIRFYNAGSSECFGNTADAAADETTNFSPRSPYAMAKAAAFWQVANYRDAYKLFACSGILFNHESPLRQERYVTQKIARAAARIADGSSEKLQLGNLDIARDWGWAPEYVDAMWRMLQQDTPKDFVIATGQSITLAEFAERAFAAVNLDWRDHVRTSDELLRPSDILTSRANPERASRELGWQAVSDVGDVVASMVAAARTGAEPA